MAWIGRIASIEELVSALCLTLLAFESLQLWKELVMLQRLVHGLLELIPCDVQVGGVLFAQECILGYQHEESYRRLLKGH